jgi:hypothetical protein
MSEEIICSGCQRHYKWSQKLAGKKVRCKCGEVIAVPLQVSAAEVPLAMLEAVEDTYDVAGASQAPRRPAPALAPLGAVARAAAAGQCPSCKTAVKPGAVICVNCGYNLQAGTKLRTEIAAPVRQATGQRAAPSLGRGDTYVDGFFGQLSRSWQFVKISYGIIWDFKQLLIFPLLSTAAAIMVSLSFVLPLWSAGTLEAFLNATGDKPTQAMEPWMWPVLFLFYYCSYFVIVFFNTALIACAMKVVSGEVPTVGYGLSIALKRLPQIAAWALVSAVVGILLKAIENANEKVGKFIAAILGTGWTVLTYFVVPVLAVDGVGPVQAVKTSVSTLRKTWGLAVVGNFSMGLLTVLITLPIWLVFGVVGALAFVAGNWPLFWMIVALGVMTIILVATASSAADVIFKALLFNYATGRSLPADVDESLFAGAFGLPTK